MEICFKRVFLTLKETGCGALIYASEAKIQPKCFGKIRIFLIPKTKGKMLLESVCFGINRNETSVEIPIPQKISAFDINVVDPIPLLRCHFLYPSLNVLEGEIIINSLEVQNVSDSDVTVFKLKVLNDEDDIISFGNEEIFIGGKRSVSIPVQVTQCTFDVHKKRNRFVPSINEDSFYRGKEFLLEITYGNKWLRKKTLSLKIRPIRSLILQDEDDGKNLLIKNVSKRGINVFLENGKSFPVPPSFSKRIFSGEKISHFITETNITVYYKDLFPSSSGQESNDSKKPENTK